MRPLSEWPLEDRRQITGVFTDIDDTLTTSGAITTDALRALADLKTAGLHVIAITGRPVGWSAPFALSWPIDAIVAENGAVALVPGPHPNPLPEGEGEIRSLAPAQEPEEKHSLSLRERARVRAPSQPPTSIHKLYQQDASTRATNFACMQHVAQRVLLEVPGTQLAQDSAGRETDIAIDHSEFTHLPPEKIAHVVRIMQSAGMNASVSSIHINGWFGAHNKLEGARWIARELLGHELDAEIGQWVYVGDSTNDQIMFEHFSHSIGVANIRRFEAELMHRPRYITASERGAGFSEVAKALLDVRARS